MKHRNIIVVNEDDILNAVEYYLEEVIGIKLPDEYCYYFRENKDDGIELNLIRIEENIEDILIDN